MAHRVAKPPPDYCLLHKAAISFDYLHTNSTTHEFVFGAIAELVDNSRDADAKNLRIDFDEKKKCLSFCDDGVGMTPEELTNVVCFGHSVKKNVAGSIGQYGNGLKSGAMRLAKDFIIFTKRASFCSALLLSRTFHENKRLQEILVPAPVFTADGMEPVTGANLTKHQMEMELIYEYSPYKNEHEFMSQFDKIEGDTGTTVVLFNLRMVETGAFEMDFRTDQADVQLTDKEKEREEERNSLRAYLAVLYVDPYMKIYLRGVKVNTIRIFSTLSNPCFYHYMATNLKSCAELEYQVSMRRRLRVEDELNQAKSEYGVMMEKTRRERGGDITDREAIAEQRRKNMQVEDLQNLLNECEKKVEAASKARKKPTPLQFYFGLNLHHRNRYGCMVYNNGRLIDMYVKLPVQKENHDIYMRCLGVVGVVNVSYSILQPTHNKQSFENKREYQNLLKAMNEHMEQYWRDLSQVVGVSPDAVKAFWKSFGYEDTAWNSECDPSNEAAVINRYRQTHHCIQCNVCLKWRMVPYQRAYLKNGIPANWKCSDRPAPAKRSCDVREDYNELTILKRGTLKKQKKPEPVEPAVTKKSPPFSPFAPERRDRRSVIKVPKGPEPAMIKSSPSCSSIASENDNRHPMRHAPRKSPPKTHSPSHHQNKKRADHFAVNDSPQIKKEVEEEEEVVQKKQKNAGVAVQPRKTNRRAIINSSSEFGDHDHEERQQPKPSPPRKRAFILSDDDEDEEEEPVVEKRARTKADARRELEERMREKIAQQIKKEEEEELTERAQQAKNQMRTMLQTLHNLTGDAALGELLKQTDEDLLNADLEQAMNTFTDVAIAAPKREIEEIRLPENLLKAYPVDGEFANDVTDFMNYANDELEHEGDGEMTVTPENCFDMLHKFAHMVKESRKAMEEKEERQESEEEQRAEGDAVDD